MLRTPVDRTKLIAMARDNLPRILTFPVFRTRPGLEAHARALYRIILDAHHLDDEQAPIRRRDILSRLDPPSDSSWMQRARLALEAALLASHAVHCAAPSVTGHTAPEGENQDHAGDATPCHPLTILRAAGYVQLSAQEILERSAQPSVQ